MCFTRVPTLLYVIVISQLFQCLCCSVGYCCTGAGVLGAPPTASPRPANGELVAVGDVMADFLQKLPLSVNIHVNKAQCVGKLDKKTRYIIMYMYRSRIF